MNIQTAFFGETTIDEKGLIRFEHGLPGFDDERRFVILPLEGNDAFHVLQSVDTEQVAFVVTNPFLFGEYTFEIDEATVHALGIEGEEDVAIISIVTVKEPFDSSTVNLKAPVILNTRTGKGKQVILDKADYPIRRPLAEKG
ncbi:flagellar assembly protein FliW [Indiicoccus explosivorum]|uniref:flagellar assembly protein FliW n=1 Tax=Indiicoccus explosivorum TaxID=1917864 RepID=UPI000B4398EA|nr:flagellar assembly protein FliW [Indiicoccus explosivorum]